MSLGKVIKTIRVNQKINQRDYAEKIGTSQVYMSQIEKDRKMPSIDVIKAVALDAGVPVGVLLWFAVDQPDVPSENIEEFKRLKPSIDKNIRVIFKSASVLFSPAEK